MCDCDLNDRVDISDVDRLTVLTSVFQGTFIQSEFHYNAIVHPSILSQV